MDSLKWMRLPWAKVSVLWVSQVNSHSCNLQLRSWIDWSCCIVTYISKLAITWFKLTQLRVQYETRTALGHAENSWLIQTKAFSRFLHISLGFVSDWVLIVSCSDPSGPFCASWINNEITFQYISTCCYSTYNLAKIFDLRPCTPLWPFTLSTQLT